MEDFFNTGGQPPVQEQQQSGNQQQPVQQEGAGKKLPEAPIFGEMAEQFSRAQEAGAAKGLQVMEIDPSAPPEVQAAERAQAQMMGLRVVIKGQQGGDRGGAGKQQEGGAEPHPLFGFGEQGGRDNTPVPQPVADYFKSLGYEKPEEFVRNLPQQIGRLTDLEVKYQEAESSLKILDTLSEDVQQIIESELQGKDWRQAVRSTVGVDYTKPFSHNRIEDVVAALAPQLKITDDQWKEYRAKDGDPRDKQLVDAAIDIAKQAFEPAREKYLNKGKLRQQQREEMTQRRDASRSKALDVLRQLPGGAAHVSRVAKALTPEGLRDIFFEKDGVSWKADAAISMLMYLDRNAILGAKADQLRALVEGEANKSFLRRTDERSRSYGGGGGRQEQEKGSFSQALADFNRTMRGGI